MFDLLVRGGRAVLPDGVRQAEIGVRDGQIAAIGDGLGVWRAVLDATDLPAAARRHGAHGRAHIDYAFHLIIGDPTPDVLGRELPEPIADGCTSLKLHMNCESLRLDDHEVLRTLDAARRLAVAVCRQDHRRFAHAVP